MKRKWMYGVPISQFRWENKWLAMKLFCFLFLVWVLPATASVYSQQQRIDVTMKDVSLETLIKEIKSKVDLDFLYNIQELEKNGKVSIQMLQATVEEIMQEALKGKDLKYALVNGVIVIKALQPSAPQQGKIIQGIVRDPDGKPIPGVAVLIKGTNVGVTTDQQGRYKLIKPSGEDVVLIFSFIGMKKKTIPYKNEESLDVKMEDDIYELNTVNVISTGYQNLDPRRLTSAITSVKAEDVLVPGMTSIDQALEGRIPELLLMSNSGEVGATPRIRVRGTSSLIGNREPLWVLDGFILRDPVNVSNEDLNNPDYINLIGNAIAGINPEDIARIDVLKDAAATALYGTKAANGVIVITTKKGAIGKARVTYSHSSKLTRRPRYTDRAVNLMNSQERVQFGKELADAHYKFPENMPMVGYEGALYRHQTGKTNWDQFQDEVAWYEEVNTDWFKILTHDTYSHSHTLSVSGGTDDVRYYVSVGYNYEDGVTRKTNTERYTTMAKMDVNFTENLRMNVSLNANIQKKNHLQDQIQAMEYAYNTTRALPCYNEDGTLFYYDKIGYGGMNRWYNNFQYNILNEIQNSSKAYDGNSISASIDLRWTLMESLDLTVAGNYGRSGTLQEDWWGEKSHYVARLRNAEYGEAPVKGEDGYCIMPYGGVLNTSNSISEYFTFRAQAEYRKFLGMDQEHLLTAMGGFEMNGNTDRSIRDVNYGFMKERGLQFVDGIDLENFPHYKNWINQNHRTLTNGLTHEVSGYVTLGYGYKNHFNLNANARIDASNKFGDRSNDRFLPIWSVSGMWNAKENLLKNVDLISDFSVRSSFGLQGNMLDDESPNLIIKQGATDAIYNENISTISRYPNPNLSWEKTRSVDAGVDVGLFNSRLNVSFSWYYKKTTDCFTTVNVSSVNGLGSYVMNGGSTENSGYSVYVSATPVKTKDWNWNVSCNWSGNFNKVRSGSMDTYTYGNYLNGSALVDGEPISSFYSYRFIGLDPSNGVPMFDDYGDRRHLLEYKSLQDVIKLGMDKSGQRDPIFSGNFATTLKYKGWSVSGNFSYNLGSKVRLLSIYGPVSGGVSAENNVRKEFVNRWQVPGDERRTNIPTVMSNSHPDYENYRQHFSGQTDAIDHIPQFASTIWDMYDNSDLRVISGNYLKCSSLSFRYTFASGVLKKTPFSNATISMNTLNLFTISAKELKGQDPSQQGFSAISMSVRPSYTLQFSVTF